MNGLASKVLLLTTYAMRLQPILKQADIIGLNQIGKGICCSQAAWAQHAGLTRTAHLVDVT